MTPAGYETAWRLRIEPRSGATPVRRITPAQIDGWIADLIEVGLSASRISASLGVLKRVLDLAVRDRAIHANPCAMRSAKLPRRQQTERPVLSPVEVEALAGAMDDEADRVLVRLLAYVGLRIGEAFALSWSDVDTRRRTLMVRQSVSDLSGRLSVGPTKTYATRTIALPASLTAKLGELPKTGELVFPNRHGNHRRYRNFRRDLGIGPAKRPGSGRSRTIFEGPARPC